MKIVLIQPDIIWESPVQNLEKYNNLLDRTGEDPDLIILPEMFTTGFSMRSADLALPPDNPVIDWMRNKAIYHGSAITGSIIIADKSTNSDFQTKGAKSFFNRLFFIDNKGNLSYYDKRHMFRMGGEGENFSAGNRRLIVNHRGWRICPLICYDLRFPVWSRNREEYDLLIYLSNWPAVRSDVWNTLLKARAMENQSWVIGVNRVGKDGEGIDYAGESQIIDPKGKVILKAGGDEGVFEEIISLEDLYEFRKKFPAWKDRDHFEADW
jgi:predicted amidohydrolase